MKDDQDSVFALTQVADASKVRSKQSPENKPIPSTIPRFSAPV
jgi:hypothetical protein